MQKKLAFIFLFLITALACQAFTGPYYWQMYGMPGNASWSFQYLNDIATRTGQSGKVLAIKEDETGYEWINSNPTITATMTNNYYVLLNGQSTTSTSTLKLTPDVPELLELAQNDSLRFDANISVNCNGVAGGFNIRGVLARTTATGPYFVDTVFKDKWVDDTRIDVIASYQNNSLIFLASGPGELKVIGSVASVKQSGIYSTSIYNNVVFQSYKNVTTATSSIPLRWELYNYDFYAISSGTTGFELEVIAMASNTTDTGRWKFDGALTPSGFVSTYPVILSYTSNSAWNCVASVTNNRLYIYASSTADVFWKARFMPMSTTTNDRQTYLTSILQTASVTFNNLEIEVASLDARVASLTPASYTNHFTTYVAGYSTTASTGFYLTPDNPQLLKISDNEVMDFYSQFTLQNSTQVNTIKLGWAIAKDTGSGTRFIGSWTKTISNSDSNLDIIATYTSAGQVYFLASCTANTSVKGVISSVRTNGNYTLYLFDNAVLTSARNITTASSSVPLIWENTNLDYINIASISTSFKAEVIAVASGNTDFAKWEVEGMVGNYSTGSVLIGSNIIQKFYTNSKWDLSISVATSGMLIVSASSTANVIWKCRLYPFSLTTQDRQSILTNGPIAGTEIETSMSYTGFPNNTLAYTSNWSEDSDTLMEWEPTLASFTPKSAGWYLISINSYWATNGTGVRALQFDSVGIVKYLHAVQMVPPSAYDFWYTCSFAAYFPSGSSMRVKHFQNSGGTLNTSATLTIKRLN